MKYDQYKIVSNQIIFEFIVHKYTLKRKFKNINKLYYEKILLQYVLIDAKLFHEITLSRIWFCKNNVRISFGSEFNYVHYYIQKYHLDVVIYSRSRCELDSVISQKVFSIVMII